MKTTTLLSWGMGVESTAILVRWLKSPETRPCSLEDLIVITAQTGDEYEDTRRNVEEYILPLLREHRVRFVQVARHGHLESDGITVLSDTDQPDRLFIEGDYKLSDELRSAGTIPQFAGTHQCSIKSKGFTVESWLKEYGNSSIANSGSGELSGASLHDVFNCDGRGNTENPQRDGEHQILHAFGYNADEQKRVAKCVDADKKRMAFGFNANEQKRVARARQYDSPSKVSIFPLVEWNWTREDCVNYLHQQFGIIWRRSCCTFCPFNNLDTAAIERHKAHPEQVADALMLEHVSLSLNPRGTLYRNKSLVQVTMSSGNQAALTTFAQKLDASPWAIYRVRRIYQAKKDADGRAQEDKKGQALRAVEKLESFTGPAAARTALSRISEQMGLPEETEGLISYVFVQRRAETYPAREEFYVAAPATVETKARYGMTWFEEHWTAAQARLF